MEERTQEYYMCGGDLQRKRLTEDTTTHLRASAARYTAGIDDKIAVLQVAVAREQAQPEVDVAPFPGFVAYEEAATKYALLQREHFELQETFAHQQCEAEKWRQLYSVSRHQATRALDMLNSAKVQIEVLENKLNGRQ